MRCFLGYFYLERSRLPFMRKRYLNIFGCFHRKILSVNACWLARDEFHAVRKPVDFLWLHMTCSTCLQKEALKMGRMLKYTNMPMKIFTYYNSMDFDTSEYWKVGECQLKNWKHGIFFYLNMHKHLQLRFDRMIRSFFNVKIKLGWLGKYYGMLLYSREHTCWCQSLQK